MRHADCRLRVVRARLSFSRMSAALAVQMKGLEFSVVVIDVFVDGSDAFFDAAQDAAPQLILTQVAEEPLYHVEPRAASGREVRVETGMTAGPAPDLGCLCLA